jgi:3-dehydroquinate synthase
MTDTTTITVGGAEPYDILIGRGLLPRLAEQLGTS